MKFSTTLSLLLISEAGVLAEAPRTSAFFGILKEGLDSAALQGELSAVVSTGLAAFREKAKTAIGIYGVAIYGELASLTSDEEGKKGPLTLILSHLNAILAALITNEPSEFTITSKDPANPIYKALDYPLFRARLKTEAGTMKTQMESVKGQADALLTAVQGAFEVSLTGKKQLEQRKAEESGEKGNISDLENTKKPAVDKNGSRLTADKEVVAVKTTEPPVDALREELQLRLETLKKMNTALDAVAVFKTALESALDIAASGLVGIPNPQVGTGQAGDIKKIYVKELRRKKELTASDKLSDAARVVSDNPRYEWKRDAPENWGKVASAALRYVWESFRSFGTAPQALFEKQRLLYQDLSKVGDGLALVKNCRRINEESFAELFPSSLNSESGSTVSLTWNKILTVCKND